MEVTINVNIYDSCFSKYAEALFEPLVKLSDYLSQSFGGEIEHLWVDFELTESFINTRTAYSFRFQKRVSGKDKFTGIDQPDKYNVGHYSVRPDYEKLKQLSLTEVVPYAISLVFESTKVLEGKNKKIGQFNLEKFRSEFVFWCNKNSIKYQANPY